MLILAIDQGTTGTTTGLFDDRGRCVARAYAEIRPHFPRPGWVEQDPEDIWQSVVTTVEEVCPGLVNAVGITNQRETTVLWNRVTGEPVYPAIVWQCRRTADLCRAQQSQADLFRARTGLPVDPYFSGTKIRWILDHAACPPVGDLAFGTIDSWLIWKLTGGAVHATDVTNASRTLLFNLDRRVWDPDLCEQLHVPMEILPDVRNSLDDFGRVTQLRAIAGAPLCGVAGDQQAALFGQACFEKGDAKNTYGTGGFLLMNTGNERMNSRHGLITTLAVGGDGRPCYALEGSVFIAGAAIQWLRDELRILDRAADSEAAAGSLDGNDGVYFVPAFVGLGAPHWNSEARGMITGLTRGTTRAHLVRAALEAMAYQSGDLIQAMEEDSGMIIPALAVDGGASANDFLVQFQADLLNRPVIRPENIETTLQGAAFMAGLRIGLWQDVAELRQHRTIERIFQPRMAESTRIQVLAGWRQALRRTLL